MADKFLANVSGLPTEIEATEASTGAAEAGDIVALDSTGKLDSSLLPVGIGADTQSITAFEALAAGDFVNVFDDAGTPSVRKADASNGRAAHGFVLAAVTAGTPGDVYFEGTNTQVTSLAGGFVYLSGSIPGTGQSAPESNVTIPGGISQILGFSGPQGVNFQSQLPITLCT